MTNRYSTVKERAEIVMAYYDGLPPGIRRIIRYQDNRLVSETLRTIGCAPEKIDPKRFMMCLEEIGDLLGIRVLNPDVEEKIEKLRRTKNFMNVS